MKSECLNMNVFDAPEGSVLVQAVSSNGTNESPSVLAFKERFPLAYEQYRAHCVLLGDFVIGTSVLTYDRGFWVAFLVTSKGDGDFRDHEDIVITSTQAALIDLIMAKRVGLAASTVYSSSANLGVDWAKLEDRLNWISVGVHWVNCRS